MPLRQAVRSDYSRAKEGVEDFITASSRARVAHPFQVCNILYTDLL